MLEEFRDGHDAYNLLSEFQGKNRKKDKSKILIIDQLRWRVYRCSLFSFSFSVGFLKIKLQKKNFNSNTFKIKNSKSAHLNMCEGIKSREITLKEKWIHFETS